MNKCFQAITIGLFTWPLLAADPAHGAALAYWPTWRGPLASGVAPEAAPPLTWSETNNVRWKVKIPGVGTATPILWETSCSSSARFPRVANSIPQRPPLARLPSPPYPAAGRAKSRPT
jgi:hypothetical protein